MKLMCVCIQSQYYFSFSRSHTLEMSAAQMKTRNLESLSSLFLGCRQSHFSLQPCFQKILGLVTAELGPLTKHIAISSQCVVMCSVDYIFNPQCVPEGWSSNQHWISIRWKPPGKHCSLTLARGSAPVLIYWQRTDKDTCQHPCSPPHTRKHRVIRKHMQGPKAN